MISNQNHDDEIIQGSQSSSKKSKKSKLSNTKNSNLFDRDSCDLEETKKVLDEYVASDDNGCIEIKDLSKEDRHKLHIYAWSKGLQHWSAGDKSARIMFVQKKE